MKQEKSAEQVEMERLIDEAMEELHEARKVAEDMFNARRKVAQADFVKSGRHYVA